MTAEELSADPRCEEIQGFVHALNNGNLDAHLEAKPNGDAMDQLMCGLVSLRDKLKSTYIRQDEANQQIEQTLDVLRQFGQQNFNATLSSDVDHQLFDALAVGVNQLGSQLQATYRALANAHEKLEFLFKHTA